MRHFCLFCLYFTFALFAKEQESALIQAKKALLCPYEYHSVNVITGALCEKETDLKFAGPYPLTLTRYYSSDNSFFSGWIFNHLRVGNTPTSNSEPIIENPTLHYQFDDQGRLKSIETGPKETPFHTLNFTYQEEQNGDLDCLVESQNQHLIRYCFQKGTQGQRDVSPLLLKKVITSDGNEISYSFVDHPTLRKKLISKKVGPGQGYLITEYYDNFLNPVGETAVTIPNLNHDFRTGRVKLQKAPLGADDTPILHSRFFYYDDHTIVYDALNHKTLYRFNRDQKLIAIENYLENASLYRIEKFFWDEKKRLKSRALEDALGVIHTLETFDYDTFGNVVKHTLFGNLTGLCDCKIVLTDKEIPLDNGIEKYATTFCYNAKGQLTEEIQDNGRAIHYGYDEKTDKICKRLTFDQNTLKKREFYLYDDLQNLICIVVDDGSSEEMEELSGITERHIKRFYPLENGPAIGQPSAVHEFYLDVNKNEEILLQRTQFTYSSTGLPIQKEIYDGTGKHQLTETFEYDEIGRLINTHDSNGNVKSFCYDNQGNQTQGSDNEKTFLNTYDYMGRCIEQTVITADDEEKTSNRYDFVGNRIAQTDSFGNETTYRFDALNREIETIYPLVATLDGSACPITSKVYDVLDRVIQLTNANGQSVKTTYNTRGQPVTITYEDEAQVSYEYNLDGSLKKHVREDGSSIDYITDYQSRAIEEKITAKDGTLVQVISREFTAFHLIRKNQLFGKSSFYTYDNAGRLLSISETLDGKTQCTKYCYDTSSKLTTQINFAKNFEEGGLYTQFERDLEGEIQACRLEDISGQILKKQTPKKDKTEDIIRNKVYNFFGQCVLQTVLTEPSGILTTTTYDALGRPSLVEKSSCLGNLLQSKEIVYDLVGNKIQETHFGLQTPYICQWTYDAKGRITSETEGAGGGLSRKTEFTYFPSGKLESICKPDSTLLYYSYTETGNKKTLKSSDGTIDYHFHYDSGSRLIAVVDKTHQRKLRRKYTADQITEEQLANGLTIKKDFDSFNRCTKLTLPDDSSIVYTYDPVYLRKIERFDPKEALKYYSDYTFSLKGEIQELQLINNIGKLAYTYDEKGNLSAIDSPFWRQKIERDDLHRSVATYTVSPAQELATRYAYDEQSQLIQENAVHYSYDNLRSRKTVNNEAVTINALGELVSQKGKQYTYDKNGNLITIKSADTHLELTYDALNRLIKIEKDSTLYTTFLYDAFNRLVEREKTLRDPNRQSQKLVVEKKKFIFDNSCEIGAVNAEGVIEELRVLGNGTGAEMGAAIALELKGQVFAPIHDFRGSVCCLIDVNKRKAVEWYFYDAFGQVTTEKTLFNPWTFCSKREESDAGLIFFGQRFYCPEMGRWISKDPLGHVESINRFAYNLNDPINRKDLFGLFSFTDFCGQVFEKLKSGFQSFLHTLNQVFSDYVEPALHKVGEVFFGRTFLQLCGFYKNYSEMGVYGRGEISDKVRFTLVNGILNSRLDFKLGVDLISQTHGGVNVHYIYDASTGWCHDMIKCLLVKFGFISPQAYRIASTWRQMIEEMGGIDGGGSIYHFAHSIGGTHTKAALRLLTKEEKSMIRIFTFGSPSTIYDEALFSVKNYVSVRDGVCLFDPIGYFRAIFGCSDSVISLGDWLGIPLIDHTFCGGTYADMVKILGDQFIQLYVGGQL